MRWVWILFVSGVLYAQTHEILRPTAEADDGAVTAIGCTGGNNASQPWPNAWDSGGISTSTTNTQQGGLNVTRYNTRVFKPWATTNQAYSSLTLNVNSSSPGWQALSNGSGNAAISYSVNNGMTWTSIRNDSGGAGWAQLTDTIALSASQNLAQLVVGICIEGDSGAGSGLNIGRDTMTVFDIWTDGIYVSPTPTPTPVSVPVTPAPPHPTIISRLIQWLNTSLF